MKANNNLGIILTANSLELDIAIKPIILYESNKCDKKNICFVF